MRWNDPDLDIDWPCDAPALSERDATAPRLKEIDPEILPRYRPSSPEHHGSRVL